MNLKKNLKNVMRAGILLIVVSGVAAACSPGIASQDEVIQLTPEAVLVQDTEVPATEVVQVGEGTPSGESESTAPPVPTARTGLESTDPGTVNLVSGEIQLIEAFAFW